MRGAGIFDLSSEFIVRGYRLRVDEFNIIGPRTPWVTPDLTELDIEDPMRPGITADGAVMTIGDEDDIHAEAKKDTIKKGVKKRNIFFRIRKV